MLLTYQVYTLLISGTIVTVLEGKNIIKISIDKIKEIIEEVNND